MHRHVFGVLGLVVLLAGIGLTVLAEGDNLTWVSGGGLVRAGILVLAIWLAMPQRADQIQWPRVATAAGMVVLAIFVVRYPRILLLFAPYIVAIAFVAYLLRPRGKRRGGKGRRKK